MISAVEALRLHTAQLTDEEKILADRLEANVEEYVRKSMERRGVDMECLETNGNVIAEVNQRLKVAGYIPQWQPIVKQHRLNAALQQHVGFRLSMSPTDKAYEEAAKPLLS